MAAPICCAASHANRKWIPPAIRPAISASTPEKLPYVRGSPGTASELTVNVVSFPKNEARTVVAAVLPPEWPDGEGCANSVSCGEVVFVDEAAEPVAALDSGGW